MKLSTFIPLAALALSNSVNAKDLIPLDSFPDWFKTSMARETKVTTSSNLTLAPFNVNTDVAGELQLVDTADGTWYYNIDIGTNAPVECYVFNEYDGPANSLYAVVNLSLDGAAELNGGPLTGQYNFAIDTGVIESTPYLLLDTLYHVGEGENKASGVIKALAAETANSLQVCIHSDIGYRDAFFDTFASFVNAFAEVSENQAFFSSIYEMRINDIPMGYASERYTKDADGDVMIESDTAFLVPVDASNVSRTDSVDISWSHPDGALINGSTYTIENGVMTSEFAIKVVDDKWHVEGAIQGKPVVADLAYDGWLQSDFGSYLETANLQQSEAQSAQFYMWSPDVDPVSAVNITLSEVSGKEDTNMALDMGPVKLDFYAEKNGIFKHGVMAQGPVNIHMQSIYRQGVPSL